MPLPPKTARIEITAHAEDIPRFAALGYQLIGENEDCIATLQKIVTLRCCPTSGETDCGDFPDPLFSPTIAERQRSIYRSIGELAETLGIPGARFRWAALANEMAKGSNHV